jgi:hypothetical protein
MGGFAAAQSFVFTDFTWSLVSSGSGSGTVSPGLMHVEGSSNAFCTDELVYFETTAPYDGTVTVHLDWDLLDICHYDWPIYVVNGAYTVIPVAGDLDCFLPGEIDVSFDVKAGDSFGLGVGSDDCLEGPGLADWTGFSFLPPAWTKVADAIDPRFELEIDAPVAAGAFGETLAAFGDVDGDGVSDLAVANPFEPTGQPSVAVYSSASGALLWSVSGASVFGLSMATPGDVNGDQVPDLVVSAYGASTVTAHSGVDGSTLWTWVWSGPGNDFYGHGLAAYADVNGDQILDVAVGARKQSSLPVRTLSGVDGSELLTIPPGPGDEYFGASLGAPGDMTGNGLGDLAVVSRGSAPRVAVHTGLGSVEILSFVPPGTGHSLWDASVSGVTDKDGDGRRDLLLAARYGALNPFNNLTGLVTIHSSDTGATLATFAGPHSGSEYGSAAAEGPDVDGDGLPELAIGARGYGSGSSYHGRVDIVRFSDGEVLQRFEGEAADELGSAIAWLDGAAKPTLALSAPEDIIAGGDGGYVQVVSDLDHPAGAPHLTGAGAIVPDTPWIFRLSRGLPGNLAGWVLGISELSAPFKGGVLVPNPDLILFFGLDGAGSVILNDIWPSGTPLPEPLWIQVWMPDPAGPKGWTTSPALMRDEP